ncbi:triadin-like isoform X1 [Leguminivora glycinivorella]|uniref:triadin-like isoform X1 n=1 Tax=Leguminivora glycinivorella TaxID=1035111 RepID=UPI0020100A6A|nr:triadin-like isoform X1 [Leguminivora glycinivorella]
MSRLGCLLLIWTICQAVLANEDNEKGFVQPLDFSPIFAGDNSGLASNPVAAALLKLDTSQYPNLFDSVVSSSLDSLQRRVAPQDRTFAAENFGFNPIASQSFLPPPKPAPLVAQPAPRAPPQRLAAYRQPALAQYDIRQIHDADYKVYKPEEDEQGEILSALKQQNPTVAAYFKPAVTNLEVAHPLKYRKEELLENPEAEQNYKPNGYIAGPPRLRRYTGEHKRQNLRKRSEDDEEDDPYDYKSEYISRPKAFDGGAYSSAYKEEKDPNKDYEYPYGYDSGYDHKEYERIKELSEKQAAEIKQNPGNCKQVNRDGMTCNVCKDPKTGGNYESCSYVAEPKNNKYAYSKEKKFNSNDEPDEPEGQKEEAPSKSAKYEEAKEDDKPSEEYSKLKAPKEESEEDDSKEKYKAYYVHSSQPTPSEKLRAASDESSEEKSDTLVKPYNYKQALPEFYTDNEPKKDVEHVLAEFKKKDRSSCNQVNKNGMTCFQCVDKNGLKNEECMFVSESAPKKSHLAYQELKEFQSQPPAPPVAATSEGAESKVVAANASPAQKTAAYVVANTGYGKKLKRKKASQATPTAAATSPVAAVASAVPAAAAAAPLPAAARRLRRSVDAEAEDRAEIADETELGPEEFAGAESKAAYWAETMPRYSAALGVTLPEFMLARSEHEASFDEIVAGA